MMEVVFFVFGILLSSLFFSFSILKMRKRLRMVVDEFEGGCKNCELFWKLLDEGVYYERKIKPKWVMRGKKYYVVVDEELRWGVRRVKERR